MTPRWLVPAIVAIGLGVRIVLLPTAGFAGDIDQFVAWVGHISRDGLGHTYDIQISFGPVMAFVWWVIGLLDPAVVAASGSADPAVRIVMKLPAVAADLALAGMVWYALRHRPGWAAAALAVILLHPAIWFVSAWWGTYDSVYVAFAVAAYVLATRGSDVAAVVALVLAVMTKPQAAPLVVPFAAWFLARAAQESRAGRLVPALRGLVAVAIAGLLTLVVLWLPFVGANGQANYVAGLGRYQGDLYGLLSLAAWNPWWAIQELVAGGRFIADGAPLVGAVSYRVAGYVATGAALLLVGVCVARRPTDRNLALGLATAALAAFELLTTMHERYAFAVLPMLALLVDDRRFRWALAVFGTTFFLNLVSASATYLGGILPAHGPLTVAGSVANVAVLVFLLLALRHDSSPSKPADISEDGGADPRRRQRDTSAGSAGAISEA